MILKSVPCPCGCRKRLVEPLFHNVDSTLDKEEADELVKRWNLFDELVGSLSGLVGCVANDANTKSELRIARAVIRKAKAK